MESSKKSAGFNIRTFSSDVLFFSLGQAILLLLGFIQSLIIPKYLSTEDFGLWQLFLLGVTYVGILNFGFLDGILIRWAGKELQDIKDEIPLAFRSLLFELIFVVGLLSTLIGLSNLPFREIALAVMIYAIIFTLFAFFTLTAQAVKNFKLVTGANIGKGALFLLFVLILFISGDLDYFLLILATIIICFIFLIILILHFQKILFQQEISQIISYQYIKDNIKIGIFVLLGNFIALIFTTIDRVTVGSFFPITQFAIYAFAMTMCGLATVFLQAVAQVFFPYLAGSSGETRTKAYTLLRPVLVIFWAGVLAVYFPFSVWIRYYLPNYADSLPLMAILLCTVGFSGQINILHANFFKVYRKQRAYFVLAGISLIGAIVLNLLAVFLFGTLTAVAATAVVSFSLWYLLNEAALRHLVGVSSGEVGRWALVIGAYIGAFLGAYAVSETWVIGFGIYAVLFAGITAVCLRRETEQLWSILREIVKRKEDV